MNNLIYYKYKNKEISTPTSGGYLIDFQKTKDWIKWLQKEFEISKDDWKKEKQFDILFKNTTTQPEYMKLFYPDEAAKKTAWGKEIKDDFTGTQLICWPPIYLHPLMEDTLNTNCVKCGNKQCYDNRKLHEFFQKQKENCYDWEKGDNVCIVKCDKCGFVGGIFKKCSYRICEDHGDNKSSAWWKEAWKKLGVNPNPIVREFKENE